MNEQPEVTPKDFVKEVTTETPAKEVKKEFKKLRQAAKVLDETKVVNKRSAHKTLKQTVALAILAVKQWVKAVWRLVFAKGWQVFAKFIGRVWRWMLSLVRLDSPEALDHLTSEAKKIAQSAGQQALAAALMALLGALAEGAKTAIGKLLEDGGSRVLRAVVEGASEALGGAVVATATAAPNSYQQPRSLFGQQQTPSYRSFDPSTPAWAR